MAIERGPAEPVDRRLIGAGWRITSFGWPPAVILIMVLAVVAAVSARWAHRSSKAVQPIEHRLILNSVIHNRGEGPTQSAWLDPRHLNALGFNGQVIDDYLEAAVPCTSIDPTLFPANSPGRQWVEDRAANIDRQIAQARSGNLTVLFFTDFIVLPQALVEKRRHELCDSQGRLDPERPATQAVLRQLIGEIFTRFPDVDGLVVRTGEVYLHDLPHHAGNNPAVNGTASHLALINLLRDELCIKRNKWLIYRTWDCGPEGIHQNAGAFLKVSEATEPHPKLIFSVKHQAGDFQRMTAFNPTLTLGRHPQLVEVQCQREVEGKGASPNYIGKGVIDGWEEYGSINPAGRASGLKDLAKDPHFAGVWSWARGGGWGGPYIRNELWCDLNTYVISQWARNPSRSEAEVFAEFASHIGVQGEDADRFRRLCLLSADAVVRGRLSLAGGVDVWWTRDDFIGGIPTLKPFFDHAIATPGKVESLIAEKAASVAIWREMETLSRAIHTQDPATSEFIATSTTYGRIQYEIYETAWTVMLLGLQGDRTGQYETSRIQSAIARYDGLWDEWRRLHASSPSCATIYRDTAFGNNAERGVGASVDRYRKVGARAAIVAQSR